jgi:hypothetical protein
MSVRAQFVTTISLAVSLVMWLLGVFDLPLVLLRWLYSG